MTIFLVSLIVSQRLIRRSSLTSLSNSRWRLVVFWLSGLIRLLTIFSAGCIVVLYGVGVGLYANSIASNSFSSDAGGGLTLMRAGVAWLLALGALIIVLVFVVVVTARVVPRHQNKLGTKLGVFFLSTTILVVGQGFHVGAIMDSQVAVGRIPFYVAGFLVDILVVLLYALTNIDVLFHERRMDSFAFAKNTTRPKSGPYGSFRKGGNDAARLERRKTATDPRGIMVRKSLAISVVRREDQPSLFPPAAQGRSLSPSLVHDGKDMRQEPFQFSDVEFSGLSRPEPLYQVPDESAERKTKSEIRRVEDRFVSQSNSRESITESPQNFPSLPYDPLANVGGREGIAALEQQLRNYELAMDLGEDRRTFY